MVTHSAAWHGTRVTLRQVSPESEPIYDFILALDRRAHEVGGWKSLAIRTGVPSAEFDGVLNYFAQFLGNGGNYKGFGDSKFIPRASEATFRALCTESEECEKALELALNTGTGIFEAKATEPMHLGYPAAGHASAYYPDSPDISKDEIQAIGDLCEAKKLQLENTRLSKKGDIYELLIAGGEETPATEDQDLQGVYEFELEGALKGKKLKLVYGDYLNEMRQIAFAMKQAIPEAENENQAKMLEAYHKSFRTGSLKAFRDSQVAWIQDKGPAVETNIGFIESYRDPHGVRAEWEGLVSMVGHPNPSSKSLSFTDRKHRIGQQRADSRFLHVCDPCSRIHSNTTMEQGLRERQVPKSGLYLSRSSHFCRQRATSRHQSAQ